MLASTFQHLRGIGPKKEQSLWKAGVESWDDFDSRHRIQSTLFTNGHGDLLTSGLESSRRALRDGHVRFFADSLARQEHYRIPLSFPSKTIFLDIETTGLSVYYDQVTLVGWSTGSQYNANIAGGDESAVRRALSEAGIIVTFNGSLFVVPFLRERFSELCLEYGPDNWVSELTGADLLRSAHRLFVGERGAADTSQPPVPSRHLATFGQDLRSKWFRFVATPDFADFARNLPAGTLTPATLRTVWQARSYMSVVAAARPAATPMWAALHVPTDLGIGREAVIVRLPNGAATPLTKFFRELCDALSGFAIDLASWTSAQEKPPEFFLLAAGDHLALRWRWETPKDELISFHTVVLPSTSGGRLLPAYGRLAGTRVGVVGCGSAGAKRSLHHSLARASVASY